jgi:predicted DNA-binding transcriptional regulator YafY
VAKGIAWYLVAQTPGGLRTFRVSRIEGAVILESAAERPHGFDLATYWTSSASRFRETLPRYDAVLCAEPQAAAEIRKWRPTVEEREADGRITMTVHFDSEEQARFVALAFALRVDVLAPDTLRARVAAEAAEIAARYGAVH